MVAFISGVCGAPVGVRDGGRTVSLSSSFAPRRAQAVCGGGQQRLAGGGGGGPVMLFGLGGGKKKADSKSKSSISGVNPFRALGVTEDATYDEVVSAFDSLALKYKSDPKMVVRLEIYRDKIMDTRLAQRISGELKAVVKESPFERIIPKKKRFELPTWVKNLVQLPDAKYARKCSILMGLFFVLGFVTPTLAGSTMALSFLTAAGFLYNRGLPDVVRDEYGNPGEVREVRMGLVGKTLGINLGCAGIMFGLAQGAMVLFGLPSWVLVDSFVNGAVVLGLWISCMLFQVQEV